MVGKISHFINRFADVWELIRLVKHRDSSLHGFISPYLKPPRVFAWSLIRDPRPFLSSLRLLFRDLFAASVRRRHLSGGPSSHI